MIQPASIRINLKPKAMKTQNSNSSPIEYSYFLDKWNLKMSEWEQMNQKNRKGKKNLMHIFASLLAILSIG